LFVFSLENRRNRRTSFDGQVRNAFTGIHYVRLYYGISRTSVNTSGTRTAIRFHGFVILQFQIGNYFPDKISIIGYKTKNKQKHINSISINSYKSGDYTSLLTITDKPDFITVEYKNQQTQVSVMQWSAPAKWTPRQELEQNNKFPNEQYYIVKDKNVIFSGKQTINSIILIPQNYKVIFEAGTEIDFVDSGGFLSYSPVFINGKKENPVIIKSSDKSARGFTILQGQNTEMNFAIFDGLNTFNFKGWTLSGAVTIYETETKINNCKFINNQCEDDLNIVRSHFIVQNSTFENTFSDAFDSDFCEQQGCNY